MLRIVGLQRNEDPDREFVLLQNQGGLRVRLRGHVLLSERGVDLGNLAASAFVFADDVYIPAGLYVIVRTGCGKAHWAKTRDGTYAYQVFIGRTEPLWSRLRGPVHVLGPLHTFSERGESLLLR